MSGRAYTKSNVAIRQPTVSARFKRRTGPTTTSPRLEGTSSNVLSLVIIPESIPYQLCFTESAGETALTALALLDLGVVTQEDCALYGVSPSELISSSLSRWLVERAGDKLSLFEGMTLCIGSDLNELGFGETEGLEDDLDLGQAGVYVGVTIVSEYCYSLKGVVERLESAVPGLGETVMSIMQNAIYNLMFAICPGTTLDAAKTAFWYGEEDETLWLEENGDECTADDIITRTDFDSNIPRWVSEAGQKLDASTLQQLAQNDDEAGEVCRLLLDAPSNSFLASVVRPMPYSCSEHGICLLWGDGDVERRIWDEHYNYLYERFDNHQVSALFSASDSSPEALSGMKQEIDKYVDSLGWLNRLIQLVGTESD